MTRKLMCAAATAAALTLGACGGDDKPATAQHAECITTVPTGKRLCGDDAATYCRATESTRTTRLELDEALGEREPELERNARICARLTR